MLTNVDLNATQAAIRAGYSPKTAEQTASRMLSFVKVDKAKAERSKRRLLVNVSIQEAIEKC